MPLDNDKLIAAIEEAKSSSYGSDEHSELGAKRAKAIEAYLGLNTNPSPAGRSQVVDRSVYETLSTIIPSLVRIFVSSSDEVCKFTPIGPDDEVSAEQVTAVVNHYVTERNNWEQICSDWIHDACLLSNGYCLAYWDESENIIRETYEGQSDDQLASIVRDQGVTVIAHSERPDEQTSAEQQEAYQAAYAQFEAQMGQYQQIAQQAQQAGQQPPPPPQEPQPPQPVMLHDLVIERRENEGKVCIKVLPPEHCYISAATSDWTLNECDYFEYVQEKTISELRAMGLDVPDDISDDEDADDTREDRARNRFSEDDDSNENGSMRRVYARMVWIRADADGDGISRMYYVIAVGRNILFAEPTGRIPVASMTPQPLPHRHIGMSIAETVIDTQEIKTAVKRGGLDNLYLSNAPRMIVSDRVNLEDLLDARPGGVVRMLDSSMPAEGHIVPVVHPFAFEQIIGSLEYFDQERQNRTGAMRGAAGLEANAMNRAAVGTTVAMQNAGALRIEHIARMMAPAVEYLFSCVWEIISKHQNKPLTLKLRGNWTTVDPQAWRTKRDVRISVGVGAGNKESMMQQLGQLFGAQMQLMPMGVAGPQQLHATVVEMAKLAGFANPGKFWIDVGQTPPPPPPPSPEQIKAQAAMQELQFKAQTDAQRLQAEQAADAQKFQAMQVLEQQKLQMQAELDRNREELDARQKQLEAQQKAAIDKQKQEADLQIQAAKMELEKWKSELDATVKLQVAQMDYNAKLGIQPDVITELQTVLGGLTASVAQISQAVQSLSDEATSPAQIIRDINGRAVGVQKGARVKTVVRDETGRAAGLQ